MYEKCMYGWFIAVMTRDMRMKEQEKPSPEEEE
jgi:hypothetical protein